LEHRHLPVAGGDKLSFKIERSQALSIQHIVTKKYFSTYHQNGLKPEQVYTPLQY